MKKTNLQRDKMHVVGSYPSIGVYENTDENGVVDTCVVTSDMVWVYKTGDYLQIEKSILAGQIQDTPQTIIPLPKEEKTITEDFALKMVALVANKDKFKDIKEV